MVREVIFHPMARRAGARVALFAVFLYSGLYHECVSFLAGSGYGGPAPYFLLQYGGVAIEDSRPPPPLLRGPPPPRRARAAPVVLPPLPPVPPPPPLHRHLVPLLV